MSVRSAAAKAEAAAWEEANQGWDKGMPVEIPGCNVVGKGLVAQGPSNQEGYQYSESKPQGSENAMGFSPWADGWQSKLDKAAPSADSACSEELMDWKVNHSPRYLQALVPVDEDGCEVMGDWIPSQWSQGQLVVRQQWANQYLQPSIEVKKAWHGQRLFDFGIEVKAEMPKGVAKKLAEGPQKLNAVSWVSSDPKGMKGLIWAERVRCKAKRRNPEKGARVIEADLGWKASKRDAVAARYELNGNFRPMSYGVNAEPASEMAEILPMHEAASWDGVEAVIRGEMQSWQAQPMQAAVAAEAKEWQQERVAALEAKMSQGQFQALQLRAEGMRAKEIAQVMECSPKRVEKLLEKGRARAKALLGQ